MLKFTIQEEEFIHTIDWSVKDKFEDGFLEEYFPPVDEAIDSFLRILGNIYPEQTIADALAEGLSALDYSEKGILARNLLRDYWDTHPFKTEDEKE